MLEFEVVSKAALPFSIEVAKGTNVATFPAFQVQHAATAKLAIKTDQK